LLVNCPYDLLLENLAKAKVYVHCYENEPFGISIVESMAAGCVPVVHRSGGAYYDIVDSDQYGLSFRTTDELACKIDTLLLDSQFCSKLSESCIQRSQHFSDSAFKKNIVNLITKFEDNMSSN
jgi:glycosyltransferase involved in cell wall biosynthesis